MSESMLNVLQNDKHDLRLPYTYGGVSRPSGVARPIYTVDKTLEQIKASRAGYQTILRILKENELSNFSQINASVRITLSKLQ